MFIAFIKLLQQLLSLEMIFFACRRKSFETLNFFYSFVLNHSLNTGYGLVQNTFIILKNQSQTDQGPMKSGSIDWSRVKYKPLLLNFYFEALNVLAPVRELERPTLWLWKLSKGHRARACGWAENEWGLPHLSFTLRASVSFWRRKNCFIELPPDMSQSTTSAARDLLESRSLGPSGGRTMERMASLLHLLFSSFTRLLMWTHA